MNNCIADDIFIHESFMDFHFLEKRKITQIKATILFPPSHMLSAN